MNHFQLEERRDFRKIVNQYLHPREELHDPSQLKGRDRELYSLQDCFETPGANAFIWGFKGVGKTSLAHTACEKYGDIVNKVAFVACEETTSLSSLILDIAKQVLDNGHINLETKTIKPELEIWGIKISGSVTTMPADLNIRSINQAVDLLKTLLGKKAFSGRCPVIIVDEFDRLKNEDTKRQITDLIKQLSVNGQFVKFIFCGIADSLLNLLGKHGSADRYIHGVELKPLFSGALLEVIEDVEREFDVEFLQGQSYRICQISQGFPHFTHLMLKDILLYNYDDEFKGGEISQESFALGVLNSVGQADVRLYDSYQGALHTSTQLHEEVIWAVAYGPILNVHYKDIFNHYLKIMDSINRNEKLTIGQMQSYLNRITINDIAEETRGKILLRRDPGWYEFIDPMLRSYTRLVADTHKADLGEFNLEN